MEEKNIQTLLNMHTFPESSEVCKARDDEYIGADGLPYCMNCKTPRCGEPVKEHFVRLMCKCQREALQQKQSTEMRKVLQNRFQELKSSSLLGERYTNACFSDTEVYSAEFEKVYKRCQKFCENANEVLSRGLGMYLYGENGRGKTHLTACMANELINQLHSVLYTNFFEIAKTIKKTFSRSLFTESEFIENLARIDFLFIDDIGTERVQKDDDTDTWLQEKIYDVINKRYNAKKPTVFTSNFSIQQLAEERGILKKTVDRIAEMSNAVIFLDGINYRLKKRNDNSLPF